MDEEGLPSANKGAVHELGAPLDDISIDELGARIDALKAEISRLEQVIADKKSSKDAAESIFNF